MPADEIGSLLFFAQYQAEEFNFSGHILRLGEIQGQGIDVPEGLEALFHRGYAIALSRIAVSDDHDIRHNGILTFASYLSDHFIVNGIPFPNTLLVFEIREVVALTLYQLRDANHLIRSAKHGHRLSSIHVKDDYPFCRHGEGDLSLCRVGDGQGIFSRSTCRC